MRNRDIIKQYVNTGKCIPEYQYNKLKKNLMNTYIRARIINIQNDYSDEYYEYIKIYEFVRCTHEQQINILKSTCNIIEPNVFHTLTREQKKIYLLQFLENAVNYGEKECAYVILHYDSSFYDALNDDEKELFKKLIDKNDRFKYDYDDEFHLGYKLSLK